jgi:hypothetical protein
MGAKTARAGNNNGRTLVVLGQMPKEFHRGASPMNQAAGQPKTLTIDREGAAANRKESLNGVPTQKGSDRDEYPPAMFKEGGNGASVKHINPTDNRGAGACIGAQCKGLSDGAKVTIEVVK